MNNAIVAVEVEETEVNANSFFTAALLAFGKTAAQASAKYHPQSGFALEIWKAADELFAAGELVTPTSAMAILSDLHKPSNVTVELSAWRKYHAIKATA